MSVEVGYAPVFVQLEFQQSFLFVFLDVPEIRFNFRVPHIPVVCRGVVVDVPVNCSDSSSSSPSAWANCAENSRVFTGAVCTFLRGAWFDSGYMFCDSSWVLLDVFHEIST